MGAKTNIKKQYEELKPKLRPILNAVIKRLKDIFPNGQVEGNIKTLESTIRKCHTKKCDDIIKFSDLVRARLFFSDKYDYDQVIHKIMEEFGKYITKIDWQQSRDYGLRYRGIVHVDFNFDGVNFELQVIPLGFKDYIEPLHKVYELLRDHADLPEDTRKHLIELHNKIYDLFEKKYL